MGSDSIMLLRYLLIVRLENNTTVSLMTAREIRIGECLKFLVGSLRELRILMRLHKYQTREL